MFLRTCFTILVLAFSLTPSQGQALPLRIVAVVPSTISETSGLICNGPNRLWSHNDGGNAPEIYEIDTFGTILRTVTLVGVANLDWEDLTQDDAGNIYVGDFGNNNNDRTNLVIYKLPPPDSIIGNSVTPTRIDFSYPDQLDFPPHDTLKNFDMEAFVAYGDSLYLFSKNRTNPFDGYTKLYRLPQDTGTYVAELLDSFYTGPGPMVNYWVSGAALSPGKDHLVLVSYARCWIFSCFEGADFFGGAAVARTYSLRQMEAAAWKDSTHLYMTDELINGTFGGNLYEADLWTLVAMPDANLGPDVVFIGDTLVLHAPVVPGASYLWSNGATANSAVLTQAGTYWVQVTAANGCIALDTIVIQFVAVNVKPTVLEIRATPNPFESTTEVEMESPAAGTIAWSVQDVNGKVLDRQVDAGNGAGPWRQTFGANLREGIYFLSIDHQGMRYAIKLIKQ